MRRLLPLGLVAVVAFAMGALLSAHSRAHGRSDSRSAAAQAASTGGVPGSTPDVAGVVFISHQQVAAAYAKGATLYNGNPEKNYRVHVFHRDDPGEVEIHQKDTDIFYVLEGSATFVTGGTVTAGKETGPGEIRAAAMEGGTVRAVTKGDVLIIPANVPHWFKAVERPTTYLGVKVR